MEILKVNCSLWIIIKKVNQKIGETHARITKKNSRRQTDGQTENSQKISLFQIFLKIECSRVPIHFKYLYHYLRDKYLFLMIFKTHRGTVRAFLIYFTKIRFLMLKSRKTVSVLVRYGSRLNEKFALKRWNGNI